MSTAEGAAAPEDEVAPGLEDADVVTKYKSAGEMAGRIMIQLKALCTAGKPTIDVCKAGDLLIESETAKVYNKKIEVSWSDNKEIPKKGIAFPTCVSINNCVCHNSPLEEDEQILIADGDMVKIDFAIHIDGFIAPLAETFIVGAGAVDGRKADVMLAAHMAVEVALRMVRPGVKTYAVTAAIDKIAAAYNCKALEGMLSHQVLKDKIDGEKAIIQNPTESLRKEHKEQTIEENEVYALDVIMSTGEGKPREGAQRTTVYKKTEIPYGLKMKASRAFYSEIKKSNATMPFTLRSLPDIKTAKLGVTECSKHGVVDAYKILWEKADEHVAQFKILCLVMPKGNLRGSVTSFAPETATSEFALSAEKEDEATILDTLKEQIGTKSKKKKKKKAKKAADGADGAAAAE